MRRVGVEPTPLAGADFKSAVSAIPPPAPGSYGGEQATATEQSEYYELRSRGSEATAGFEPAIRVLQTPPLGHLGTSPGSDSETAPCGSLAVARAAPSSGEYGAEDGIRTRDPHLGKVMLYH